MEIDKQVADKYLKTYMVEKDSGSASLIAFPTSTEEVVAFIKDANARKQPTITIGRQTGLTSATYPINNAWLLSLEKMNNIISLDEINEGFDLLATGDNSRIIIKMGEV